MKQCRSCGKARPSVLFSSPESACSICRHETGLANDPGSEVFKTQLRKACEVAGEPYEKAVERAMARCTVRLRKPKAPTKQKVQSEEQAQLEQQKAVLGDLRLHVAALEGQVAELTEELSKERDTHARTRRDLKGRIRALKNDLAEADKVAKKTQKMLKERESMLDEKERAITNLQDGMLRVTKEVRELREVCEKVEVDRL